MTRHFLRLKIWVSEISNYLSPKYVIPSRRYFSDVSLKEMFDNVSKRTRSILHANPNAAISFTTDIWTSNVSLMSMLSLTAQWVDDDFQLHKVMLQCQEMVGSHTAYNIGESTGVGCMWCCETMQGTWSKHWMTSTWLVCPAWRTHYSWQWTRGCCPNEASLTWWKLGGKLLDILNTHHRPTRNFMISRNSSANQGNACSKMSSQDGTVLSTC